MRIRHIALLGIIGIIIASIDRSWADFLITMFGCAVLYAMRILDAKADTLKLEIIKSRRIDGIRDGLLGPIAENRP